ncbi:hypothetical protein BEWA_021230 [Theileria equi strain WA]|uniref:Uncharacterized protein n=1 Tax=Theileria equi strain WA TaxID=1537102 RepID=L0AUP9_THEEQ|nr:hypothetical protein BEWA_021230 [Theileria equi strain WA]AFZ79275.1 hypothetical protein BEWA_021230 [Theileria equi strain WA]|eukprot:XP_004828941.1 hypothetical protein BEWA_021230 [Theileria equi strain WA]
MDDDELRSKSKLERDITEQSVRIDEILDRDELQTPSDPKFLLKVNFLADSSAKYNTNFQKDEFVNRDLDLPLLQPSVRDPERRICKPDGMLIGPDHPFFNEEIRSARSRNPPNVRYDVIGPFGNEPDPDLDLYPLLQRSGTTRNPPNPFDGPGFNFMDRNPFPKF